MLCSRFPRPLCIRVFGRTVSSGIGTVQCNNVKNCDFCVIVLSFCHRDRSLAQNGFKDTIEFGSEHLHFIGTAEYETFAASVNFGMLNDYFATTWTKIGGIKYSA